MGPYIRATLRAALRAPSSAVLALLGVLAVIAGLGLSVLAIRGASVSQDVLVAETAATTAAISCLWLLVRLLDMDRYSGFTQAGDQTRPGIAGRLVGRLAGATIVALAIGLPSVGVGAWLVDSSILYVLYLLTTITVQAALTGAWGSLIFGLGAPPQAVLLGGVALWIAGHLPWGQPGWGASAWGRALAAVLPGTTSGPGALIPHGLAALGLTLLAVAVLRPVSRAA